MADALDLGSSAARRGGSSPPSRTIAKPNAQSVNLKKGQNRSAPRFYRFGARGSVGSKIAVMS